MGTGGVGVGAAATPQRNLTSLQEVDGVGQRTCTIGGKGEL